MCASDERVKESREDATVRAVRPRGRGDPAFAHRETLEFGKVWIPASAGMSGSGNSFTAEGSMRRLLIVATLAASLASVTGVAAQNFPTRPVTVVVPFAARRPADALARLI